MSQEIPNVSKFLAKPRSFLRNLPVSVCVFPDACKLTQLQPLFIIIITINLFIISNKKYLKIDELYILADQSSEPC